MTRYTFCKWVGGKEWLWKKIKPYLISDHHDYYIEPFLGAGAIALHYLKWCRKHNVNKKFILSDANEGLMNVYVQIRDNLDELLNILNVFDSTTASREIYNERRQNYNEEPKNSVKSAGLFIWLMANGWRGLYRVNKNNQFNAPFGIPSKSCYDLDKLRCLHNLFQNVDFRCCSFDEITENGLIYLDPPYINTHKNYTINPPSTDQINQFIQHHQDSKIYMSNNQLYVPPMNSKLIIDTCIVDHAKAANDTTRIERLWMI